jgi:hypothetical protein
MVVINAIPFTVWVNSVHQMMYVVETVTVLRLINVRASLDTVVTNVKLGTAMQSCTTILVYAPIMVHVILLTLVYVIKVMMDSIVRTITAMALYSAIVLCAPLTVLVLRLIPATVNQVTVEKHVENTNALVKVLLRRTYAVAVVPVQHLMNVSVILDTLV